jgi:hypothetical protein
MPSGRRSRLLRTELEKSGSPNAIGSAIALGKGERRRVERLKLLLQADFTLYMSQDLKAIGLELMRSFGVRCDRIRSNPIGLEEGKFATANNYYWL